MPDEVEKKEIAATTKDVPGAGPDPKASGKRGQYTIEMDLLYNGKLLREGEKHSLGKLNKEQIAEFLEKGIIS